MIVSEIFYGVKCNRCKEQFEDGEHLFWNDEFGAIENAMESEWIEKGGKHYCSDCHEINQETDEVTIKEEIPQHVIKLKKFINAIIKYGETLQETENNFMIKFQVKPSEKLQNYEESFIREFLGDKFNSITYQRSEQEYINNLKCIITINK